MSETSSEEEDNCRRNLFKSLIIKIEPGKKHTLSPNTEMHISSVIMEGTEEDDDLSMSLWVQIRSDHFLLCSLVTGSESHCFHARFNEPVPVILYVKGNGDGSINIFAREKLKF